MTWRESANPLVDETAVQGAVETLIIVAGEDPRREGLVETPARFVKAWRELTRGYNADVGALLAKDFDGHGYDELVLETDIAFTSLCEHHLLPFYGVAHVGYIPRHRVVGLSKLVRLVVDVFAPRLQMQERITMQVRDALVEHLDPKGVIVILEARHSCVECRGAKVAGARTVTSAIAGVFKNPEPRAEALALIHNRSHP